ncbi:MAG: hypothetical protein PHC28_11070, partial [Flavobacterium sp.]|nr:hypothetical protein [Flavobacterium sp.]
MILQQNMKSFFFKKGILILISFLGNSLLAQVQNNEILFIGDNTSVYLSSNTYYFGAGLAQTKTTRTALTYGKLTFSPTATWSGASSSHFVDGYASTKGATAFVFPIGQSGVYAPAGVIPSSSTGVDGAYFRANPNTIGTTLDANVKAISPIEYWDIRGAVANAKISLTWRASSDITNLTQFEGTTISSLSNLTLAGYDGLKWVLIPSTVDATSILGGASTLLDGSITSDANVNLNSYSAFSLGSKGSACALTSTWDGSSWSPVAPVATQKVIIAGNFTATADLTACSLEVTGTSVVSVPTGFNFNISGAVTVAPTASLTFENNANLVQIDNVANAGNITVKRNSSPLIRQDYTLWSSPVNGQQLLAFSPATLTNRFYVYNPTTNLYNTIAPTFDFNIGTGYLIRMPNTHPTIPTIWNGSFTGVPNNGNIPVTMTNGGVGFRFNLTGNPYPSPINMAQFVTDNTNITGTLYFWRKTNNPLSPSYCSWTAGTFTTNGEAQVVDPIGIIQTGQGFFVEANGTGTALTFKNTQRIGNTVGQFFKTKAVERNRIWLNATNT